MRAIAIALAFRVPLQLGMVNSRIIICHRRKQSRGSNHLLYNLFFCYYMDSPLFQITTLTILIPISMDGHTPRGDWIVDYGLGFLLGGHTDIYRGMFDISG